MMKNDHYLAEIFKPSQFSDEAMALVLAQFKRVAYQKNDFVMQKGQVANSYYFVETGFARSYAIDVSGNDVTTKFYARGDILIDWHSFFLKTPCMEDIQALTPMACWRIHHDGFRRLFGLEAFREVGRTNLVNNYFRLKSHTVSMITDQAKDRYLRLLAEQPEVVHHVPLKHIATYLGITDTSLSRIRKELTKEE